MRLFVGARLLMVPTADRAKWARRHGLEPWAGECVDCGAELVVDVPFAGDGGVRGLTAMPCACGSDAVPPYCVPMGALI